MRFLSIYKSVETGALPTEAEMARMGKLVEDGMKAGFLLAVEGCAPSASGALVRQDKGKVAGDGECELRQLYDADTPPPTQGTAKP